MDNNLKVNCRRNHKHGEMDHRHKLKRSHKDKSMKRFEGSIRLNGAKLNGSRINGARLKGTDLYGARHSAEKFERQIKSNKNDVTIGTFKDKNIKVLTNNEYELDTNACVISNGSFSGDILHPLRQQGTTSMVIVEMVPYRKSHAQAMMSDNNMSTNTNTTTTRVRMTQPIAVQPTAWITQGNYSIYRPNTWETAPFWGPGAPKTLRWGFVWVFNY